MKKKLIEILERNLDYKPHVITGIEKCADEILKMAEFEALCNPDIYEASANEQFDTIKELLIESREMLVLCTLLDKSGQCAALVNKIDESLNDNWIE